jgi:hypothetical protein
MASCSSNGPIYGRKKSLTFILSLWQRERIKTILRRRLSGYKNRVGCEMAAGDTPANTVKSQCTAHERAA